VDKIYDRYIVSAERQVREIEKWLTDAELKGDEDQKKVWGDLKKLWEAQVGYLKTIKPLKKTLSSIDANTLCAQVKEALTRMGYKSEIEETMDFVRPDLLAERNTECLLVEVKGPDDQVRSERLIRYEDALITQRPLFTKKVVLVLPVYDGENFVVWGLKQLTQNKSKI
jgi:hypothetical protein